MASSVICWRCTRTLQQNSSRKRAERVLSQLSSQKIKYRSISSTETRWQEQQQVQVNSSSRAQDQSQGQPAPSANARQSTTKPSVTTTQSQVQAEPPASSPTSKLPTTSPSPPGNGLSVSEMQRQITQSLGKSRSDITTQLARRLRRTARSATETYITYGLTEAYYKSCSTQAEYTIPESQRLNVLTGKGPPKTTSGNAVTAAEGESKIEEQRGEDLGIPQHTSAGSRWWFDTLGLQPTFSTWSQVTYLHMYVLTVRLRGGLNSASTLQNYHRYLLEHFSHGAEDKMVILHSMSARGIRNRYLKDLFLQWRGLLAAYDEGLVKGDAVLAGAVWRNMWKGREDVDWEKVALLVAYMRKAISLLGELEVEEILSRLDGPQGVWSLSQQDLDSLVQKSSSDAVEAFTE